MPMRPAFTVLGLCALFLAGAASATTITIGSPDCDPPTKQPAVPGSGFVSPVSWAAELCAEGVLAYSAGGGATIDGGARHTYRIILENDTTIGPIPITSGPYTVTNGFAIDSFLNGYASYQGNPGASQFSWDITITGTFLGRSSTSVHSGVITRGQQRFSVYDLANFPRVRGTGDFVSHLTITTSGIGELHLSQSGIASLAPIPLPASALLLLGSLGVLGALGRLARARRTRAAA